MTGMVKKEVDVLFYSRLLFASLVLIDQAEHVPTTFQNVLQQRELCGLLFPTSILLCFFLLVTPFCVPRSTPLEKINPYLIC